MKDVDHNKKTNKKLKELFSADDDEIDELENNTKEINENKKCNCKNKKSGGFGTYKRNGRLYVGWKPGWATGGQEFNSDNLPSSEDGE